MAGLGRRTFAPGEVLTATNVMGYLQDQAVMKFAGTAARGSAIGTAVAEGMVSYLADTDVVQVYDGSTWQKVYPAAPLTGNIVQVKSTIKTNTFSSAISAGADVAITGLSVTITPSSATNKILVLASAGLSSISFGRPGMTIYRDSTKLAIGDTASSRNRITAGAVGGGLTASQISANYLDSPATTSSITYSIYGVNLHTGSDTVICNLSQGDSDNVANGRTSSTITVMEVTA